MPKPGPRTTPRYSEQFKAAAVRLSQLPGATLGVRVDFSMSDGGEAAL